MNCQDFWNTMPELARHGEYSGHLRECTACAALWERQRSLMAGLRAVAAESGHWQASAAVEARLLAEFRSHAGMASGPRFTGPALVWGTLAGWAAAAAVLIALAMFLVSGRQPQLARRSAPAAAEWAAAQTSPDFVLTGDSPYDDGFIPLPNTEGISPTEEVNLVRVEVPRSAMIELGFAVSAERASEPVEAEVALGADGLARAVRFLNE
jgi:hypothetical protein